MFQMFLLKIPSGLMKASMHFILEHASQVMSPVILVAVITHHTPTVM
jgi:hypothetical protein